MNNFTENDCLFHGLRSWKNLDSYQILENILSKGYILTTKSLNDQGIYCERENISYQGTNAISICFHPANQALYTMFLNSGDTLQKEDSAFNMFVNIKSPSLVLSKKLLQDLSIRGLKYATSYKRMTDEIQVLSDIPTKYVMAISYDNKISLYMKSLEQFLKTSQYTEEEKRYIKDFITYYYLDKFDYQYSDFDNQNIAKIQNILTKLNINIPIIDPLTLDEYNKDNNDEMIKRCYKLVEQNEKTLRKTFKL